MMLSRSQNKPPPILARSPGSKKENLEDMQLDKRRKVALAANGAPRAPRQALTAVNSDQVPAGCGSDAASVSGGYEFSSREDVERLLNEKMKGKNKTDYKGKSEQMMDYIKKLRACIKWLEEREDAYVLKEEKLRGTLDAEEARYVDMEGSMKRKEVELNAALDELTRNHTSLKQALKKEEADKLTAIESYDNEKMARDAAEKSRDSLSDELRKACQEASNADQQIKSLQDINKRLQDYNSSLQQYNSRLQNDATVNNEVITRLQKEKTAMMESLSSLRSHSNSLQEQLSSLRASHQEAMKDKEELKSTLECLRIELQTIREDRNLQLSTVKSLNSELERYKDSSGKTAVELDNLKRKTSVLEVTCSSQKDQLLMLQNQLNTANGNLQMADSTTLRTRLEYEEQHKLVEELQKRLADAELKIVDGEKLRKKLHNTILELKGNIRVFCRVRPLQTDRESSGADTTAVSYPSLIESQGRGIDLMHSGKKHSFTFDKVFDHGASQEDVFVEISQLVQSALDGYKVCIFAYGQTGSGKTYTMMGKQETPELKGLIPQSLEQIFETSQALSLQGWTYKMQASMLEIYNETIRDLLGSSRSSGLDANTAGGKQYTIKHDQNGNTHVSDLTVVDVCSIREVSYLLQQAANSRSVGRTQMNEQSSRSHFVFILRISGDNESTDQHVQGVLNLIDLAGSERLDKSGSTGDRLKETQHINKSLMSLSDVISSIAKKEDHIPFRNSKLTYLLQPCLGGESKTLMFVNISPESSSTGESRCSLQFASKVNSCEIGVPRRQTQMRPTG